MSPRADPLPPLGTVRLTVAEVQATLIRHQRVVAERGDRDQLRELQLVQLWVNDLVATALAASRRPAVAGKCPHCYAEIERLGEIRDLLHALAVAL